ncbi:MAG TPA: hypothetical protein PK453_23730 [Leptospiraceae bacterium]|nr:hypothetical protein [Leptospiraceae bacterium]HNF16685.1 hypothetical protein [Leptospiraceae bacterium]HNI97431.1 hypothetical protein [Leptospiraceae bacterium]HNM02669.1 hypothetical protein [Leptospiraceae bacterium]HNN02471.1 hypothetical protein [Leptospiraceae bacterium]
MKIKQIIFLLLVFILTNCNSLNSYLKDRANDFGDIASFGIIYYPIGAEVQVGHLSTGLYVNGEFSGTYFEYKGGDINYIGKRAVNESNFRSRTVFIGFDRNVLGHYEYTAQDLGEGIFEVPKSSIAYGRYKYVPGCGTDRALDRASYSRFGGKASLLLIGVAVEVNPGELLDFILGFAGIDIYYDDIHSRENNAASENKEYKAKDICYVTEK